MPKAIEVSWNEWAQCALCPFSWQDCNPGFSFSFFSIAQKIPGLFAHAHKGLKGGREASLVNYPREKSLWIDALPLPIFSLDLLWVSVQAKGREDRGFIYFIAGAFYVRFFCSQFWVDWQSGRCQSMNRFSLCTLGVTLGSTFVISYMYFIANDIETNQSHSQCWCTCK